MVEFKGVEASYFAFKRLQYIEKDVDRLMPEIELVISSCWMNLSKFETFNLHFSIDLKCKNESEGVNCPNLVRKEKKTPKGPKTYPICNLHSVLHSGPDPSP
jgi:hypothetical protein